MLKAPRCGSPISLVLINHLVGLTDLSLPRRLQGGAEIIGVRSVAYTVHSETIWTPHAAWTPNDAPNAAYTIN